MFIDILLYHGNGFHRHLDGRKFYSTFRRISILDGSFGWRPHASHRLLHERAQRVASDLCIRLRGGWMTCSA